MNKNISIWRGSNTPPTLNHLWIDETNNIKININNEWVSLLEIILKQLDNIVTLEDDQTITGNKIFTSPINLNNHSVIKSSIGNGEFKVTHYNSEKGFIIRTKWSDDKNILPLEMLSTNGYTAHHLYKFPEKSGTLLVDSDMQSFKDDINTSITAETSLRINNIENNVIPKAVAEGIAQVVANAPEDLDTIKEVADYIASDKTKAAEIETSISNLNKKDKTHDDELQVVGNRVTFAENQIIGLQGSVTTIQNNVTNNTNSIAANAEEIATKAPKVGYAPDLKVDFAKELVGRGVAEPQVIGNIRPTGEISIGDGNATIERVKGKSVIWNQKAPTLTVSNYKSNFENYATVSQELEGLKLTTTAVPTNLYSSAVIMKDSILYKQNHVYCFYMTINADTDMDVYIAGPASNRKLSVGFNKISIIIRNNEADKERNFYIGANTGTPIGSSFVLTKYKIYDLTQMFGVGNEPTTIEEFEARKPFGITDEYNEGEIISYDAKELKSVGFNALNIYRTEQTSYNKNLTPTDKKNFTTSEYWNGFSYNGYYDIYRNITDLVIKDGRITGKQKAEVVGNAGYGIGFPLKVVPNANYELSVTVNKAALLGLMFANHDGTTLKYYNKGNSPLRVSTTPQTEWAVVVIVPNNEECALDVSDICLHLVHSGYRNGEYQPYEDDTLRLPNIKAIKDKDGNQLFPYGLLSAGSAHDEITAKKAVKRIGVVDLGTLSWGYRDLNTDFLSGVFAPNPKYIGETLCVKYCNSKEQYSPNQIDRTIRITNTYKAIVKDSSYTDATTFKQAMQGVLLYYELAEPIEVDLPEPLNMTYEAWDFGTEELVAEGKTTPLNADIVYQFNAVDRIRENTAKNQALEAELAELKAQLTKLTQVSN